MAYLFHGALPNYVHTIMKNHMQSASFGGLAQFVLDSLITLPESRVGNRAILGLLHRFRHVLIALSDPLIRYDLDGTFILLPLSHDLPLYRKIFPAYSSNIARIAKQIISKYPDLHIIAIGANVGDDVALLRKLVDSPILCIEGDQRFFSILQMNMELFSDVYLENAFVGNTSGLFKGEVVSSRGTGTIRENDSSTSLISTQTLSNILKNYQAFSNSKMIKIDTDGFDISILQSELDLLACCKPVVFFEYDPYFAQSPGQPVEIFRDLQDAGYAKAIIYENNGDYLLTADMGNKPLLEDLYSFYTGRFGKRYCDICVFHKEDIDLCEMTRRSEILFFDDYRSGTQVHL